MNSTQQIFQQAQQSHRQGSLSQAKQLYEQALLEDSDHVASMIGLGVIALQSGDSEVAIKLLKKVLALSPESAEAHKSLGSAFKMQGDLEAAVTSFQKALSVRPDYAEAHNNLGNVYKDLGDLEAAEGSYRRAVAVRPNYANAYNNLGTVMVDQGNEEGALECYQKAIALHPDFAQAYNNLGVLLVASGRREEAVAFYQKAITLSPTYHEALNNLGVVLVDLGKVEEAIACYEKAIALKPDYVEAFNNLSGAFQAVGMLDDAVACYQKVFDLKADYVIPHSNRLLLEHYRPGHTAQTLYDLHRDWETRFARKYRTAWPDHRNAPDPEKIIRIGFVSADLGRHPIGDYLRGVLQDLSDDSTIHTTVYSDRIADDMTQRIKASVDMWHETRHDSDEALSAQIQSDEIDILFDLAGHSAKNRLLVFARKPSPVQISWVGYVGTTGLDAMDYVISDRYSTLREEEPFYSEKVLRMPDSWLCYTPPDYAPSVGELPCLKTGNLTFCSFNNPSKYHEEVLELWVEIMDAVPDACLLLKYRGFEADRNVSRFREKFEKSGGDNTRLRLEGSSPHEDLLSRYNAADIALDPFPYAGGVTTCEALWMGVPVVTLPGKTFESRHSLSFLSTIGLPELVAKTKEEYVQVAVELAYDRERLLALRSGLRENVKNSPLYDSKAFSENFSTILRRVWRDWCESSLRR